MKLNRSQIKEALEQTPIDKIMLGGNAKDISLTHKQKAFCEQIAKGESKAKAYRTAYNSHSNSHTQSKEGAKLLANPKISSHVESIRLAIEAQKYLFPTHLRALVIQQLTEKALDPSVNHAQQIKALELIGKFSDVNLFQERKEIKSDTNSIDAKQRLLDTLSNAIRSSRTISEDKKKSANDLLNEIAQGMNKDQEPITIDQSPNHDDDFMSNHGEQEMHQTGPNVDLSDETPPTPTPPKKEKLHDLGKHTIPHEQSPTLSVDTAPTDLETNEGEGVSNFWEQFEELDTGNTPLDESGSHE